MKDKIKIIAICHGKTERILFRKTFELYLATNEIKSKTNIAPINAPIILYSILYYDSDKKEEKDSSIQINNYEKEIIKRFNLKFIQKSSIETIDNLKKTNLYFLTLIDINEKDQDKNLQNIILNENERIIKKILKKVKINEKIKIIDNYKKSIVIYFDRGFEKSLKRNHKEYEKERKEKGFKKHEFLDKKLREININSLYELKKFSEEKMNKNKTNFLDIFNFFDLITDHYVDLNKK